MNLKYNNCVIFFIKYHIHYNCKIYIIFYIKIFETNNFLFNNICIFQFLFSEKLNDHLIIGNKKDGETTGNTGSVFFW